MIRSASPPLYVTALPADPFDGQEVYLIDGTVDRHLRWNGGSWRPVAGKHAASHASGGSDPITVASLSPKVIDGILAQQVYQSAAVTVNTGSVTTLTGSSLTVLAGEVALLTLVADMSVAASNILDLSIYTGASGGARVGMWTYAEGRAAAVATAVVSPTADTIYRGIAQRVAGTGSSTVFLSSLTKIVVGGKP